MIHHATRDATLKKVEDQYKKIPRNLLQKGIETLAASPEAYLFIRNQFARSLATFNISSYIIGIGDRHLDNFLLNQAEYVMGIREEEGRGRRGRS
jgi:DNA-dependent protein kinase catalytic subunit